MTVRLLNSCVMPREGDYQCRRLTPTEFAWRVKSAHGELELVSYVGYPAAAALFEHHCGVPVPLNRESTPLEDGDVMLVGRLVYRVDNPALKGHVKPVLADYEFFEVRFSEANR